MVALRDFIGKIFSKIPVKIRHKPMPNVKTSKSKLKVSDRFLDEFIANSSYRENMAMMLNHMAELKKSGAPEGLINMMCTFSAMVYLATYVTATEHGKNERLVDCTTMELAEVIYKSGDEFLPILKAMNSISYVPERKGKELLN